MRTIFVVFILCSSLLSCRGRTPSIASAPSQVPKSQRMDEKGKGQFLYSLYAQCVFLVDDKERLEYGIFRRQTDNTIAKMEIHRTQLVGENFSIKSKRLHDIDKLSFQDIGLDGFKILTTASTHDDDKDSQLKLKPAKKQIFIMDYKTATGKLTLPGHSDERTLECKLVG